MSRFPRYAIYYAPEADSALAQFGASMLGYDAANASEVDHPADLIGAVADWHDLTGDPRNYGFHATLKAPFALNDTADETQLIEACARFAATARDIPVITPIVQAISGFVAIVPTEPSPSLATLAQDCVEAFDGFRAPLTSADRTRRKPDRLSARQVAQLDRWGYPYVMDDFRFHMTLTSRLPDTRQPAIVTLLQQRFAALRLDSLAIDRIALSKQDLAGSRFQVIRDFALSPRPK